MRLLLVELEKHFPLISHLRQPLADALGFEVDVAHQLYAPAYSAFHASRGQWDGENLLRQVSSAFKHAPYSVVLAYFPHDVFAKGYPHTFGIAENNGKAALVSYYRLDPARENRVEEKLFASRVLKKSLHEIGHALGLPHCHRRHCLMNFSRTLLFLDRKSLAFCPSCRFLLAPVSTTAAAHAID